MAISSFGSDGQVVVRAAGLALAANLNGNVLCFTIITMNEFGKGMSLPEFGANRAPRARVIGTSN